MRATIPWRARDMITMQTGKRLGVSGQTIKNWVQRGELTGFRVGSRIMVPADAVAAYWRLARASLDLGEVSDEEAVQVTRAVRGQA